MKNVLFVGLLLLMSVLYVQQAVAQKEQHKDYAGQSIAECNACHKSEGIAPTHTGDWLRNHRTYVKQSTNNCAQCHNQSFCLDCHKGGGINADLTTENFGRDFAPQSHRSNFIAIHPIKALDNPQTCYRCHDQKYCTDCHNRFPKGNLRIKSHLMLGANGQRYAPALNEHATEARRNLQSCQTCHPEGDVCIQCHSNKPGGTNPHPRNWKDIKNNFKNRAGDKTCRRCHQPGTF
ncbi:MAG TPA: cytochrome C [Geobacteraceae bacterium]